MKRIALSFALAVLAAPVGAPAIADSWEAERGNGQQPAAVGQLQGLLDIPRYHLATIHWSLRRHGIYMIAITPHYHALPTYLRRTIRRGM